MKKKEFKFKKGQCFQSIHFPERFKYCLDELGLCLYTYEGQRSKIFNACLFPGTTITKIRQHQVSPNHKTDCMSAVKLIPTYDMVNLKKILNFIDKNEEFKALYKSRYLHEKQGLETSVLFE